jgi:glycerol uptake facilitator-like aquaporin
MSDILFSAVTTGFFMVRLFRGPWLKNPQYLAAAICGSILAALTLHLFWPVMDDSFVVGGATGRAGSWAGMALFDLAVGAV